MRTYQVKTHRLKIFHIFLFFLVFALVSGTPVLAEPQYIYPDTGESVLEANPGPGYITAESALVIEFETGKVFWEKNSSKPMYPASITKILSTIIAIENTRYLNKEISISKNAAGRNSSAFTFKRGDTITVIDLIKAALIVSHNNATVALAEEISGSEEDFVELMNRKAAEIGAENSFFQNTNGLDAMYPLHMTTARDIALITEYSLGNDLFREIVASRRETILVGGEEVELESTNKLLVYDYIQGVKTGYTLNSGFCMVVFSDKNGLELITVVLNSEEGKREEDVLKLLNWAYGSFEYTKIIDSKEVAASVSTYGSTSINIDMYPAEDLTRLIDINSDIIDFTNTIHEDINLPLEKNDVLGSIEVSVNQEKIKEIDLIVRENLPEPYMSQSLTTAEEKQSMMILIFLLSFYFFIFIFIIVRDLFIKKRVII